jgi:hypothetical protein
MLTSQICLVLGAGASQPYGFPTGGELMQYITSTQPDEWWPLAKAVTGYGKNDHEAFVSRLRVSGVASIDKFIGGNPSSDNYAKALIAQFVGRGEDSDSVLRANPKWDWVNSLIDRIVDDSRKLSDVKPKWPHIVTFNYDRSFEEIMLRRFAARFEDAEPALVADMLRKWEIVHVHGSLGEHPALTVDGSGREFARTLDPAALQAAVKNIELVHDVSEDSPEFKHARELIRESSMVFFLGFAFDSKNVARLFPAPLTERIPGFFATQWPDAASAIQKARARGVILNGPDGIQVCRDLLIQHSNSYSD